MLWALALAHAWQACSTYQQNVEGGACFGGAFFVAAYWNTPGRAELSWKNWK